MKISTIHSFRLKFIAVMALLLTANNFTMAQTGYWDSYKASGYESGSGTQASPYVIKTAEQLAYFAWRVTNNQDRSAYVELDGNIDLGAHWWRPIGQRTTDGTGNDGTGNGFAGFQGSFNGNGYTISNLRGQWGSEENHGFFSIILGGSVRNIIFDNAYLTNSTGIGGSARRVGILAAATNNSPVIENIIVRNSKIDITSPCSQNGTWLLVGGLVGGSYKTPKYANIYADVDVDLSNITSYSSNSLTDRSWFSAFLGGTDRPGAQPSIQNVYVAGSLKVTADMVGIGTIVGSYNSSTNKTNAIKGNVYYENVPSVNGTATVKGNKDGTKSSGFSSVGFIDIANNYVENSTNSLEKWRITSGEPSFNKVSIGVKEDYTSGSKETSYVLSGADAGSIIVWTVDGKKVTPDAGSDGTRITLPLINKLRKGVVTVTTADGLTVEKNFIISPKYYSLDGLYAASYAGGRGTKDDPYLIENDMQLARLAYEVNNAKSANDKRVLSGMYFKLVKDIDLSMALWMPIGNTFYDGNQRIFAGKFLGNCHTISNMRICWTDKSGDWSTWGLFAQLKGQSANESSFCSVSDLIIDHASIEKEEGYVPITGNKQGLNLGILVGELNPFTEVSNIIVKNSVITDNEETYSCNSMWQIGGVIANISNGSYSNIYRIYNISCDTKINMLKNANVSKYAYIGGVFGGVTMDTNAQSYQIYPTNIYAHGAAIDVADSKTSDLRKGAIAGKLSKTAGNNWYYANPATGSKVYNDGVQKSLADFAKTFVLQNNTYIQDNTPSDSVIWVYSEANGFAFGNTILTIDRTNGDIITATTPGKDDTMGYYWYVSQDRKTWTQVMQADGVTPLLQNTLSLPYQKFDLYVYAELKDNSSSSQIIKVEKLTFKATLSEDKGTYTVNVTNNIWKDNDKFKITYQWKKNSSNVGTDSPTYTPADNITASDKISCEVTVTDKNNNTIYHNIIYKATVVYLCPAGVTASDGTTYAKGEDKEDADWGYSPEKPMLTWRGAYSKLEGGASWTENVIVLMGTSAPTDTNNPTTGFNIAYNTQYNRNEASTPQQWKNVLDLNSPLFRNTTITGAWDNVDYKGQMEVGGDMSGLHLFGDTRFENITFNHKAASYDIIYCQYNNLEMGDGVVMTNYNASSQGYETIDGSTVNSVQIFGGFLNDGRFYPLNNVENIKKFEESMPHGKEGFSITLKSGHYSTICAGGRQAAGNSKNKTNQNGVMGTPNLPIKCTITVDIDRKFNDEHNDKNASYDVGTVLAGNHEGAMYGDVDIIIRSGTVARVVNGTLGNQRVFTYNAPYNPPFNSYMGRANILIDPASSEHAQKGEPLATTNERVIVTEVYGGSLGRGFESGISIDNPFYGISTVTINGGTFKILPKSNAKNPNVLSGIYGAGAGGMMGIGDTTNHTPDDRIAYWNSTKDVMLYGDYNTAKNNLIHYQCYNADTQTTTDIDPTETKTNIVINGGVFGTDSSPLDGIYAGGSGYMSPGLWYTDGAIPNIYGGNVYGKTGKTVASLIINGGTFYCTNGVFAGGRGTDKFFTTNRLNNKNIGGNRADYKELGKTYGNVELTINNGTFHCPVYGGGYGVADSHQLGLSDNSVETLTKMARVYGKSTVNIFGGTFYKNIYGGGDMALVDYSGEGVATNVIISDSTDIRGNVFGGGNGKPYLKQKKTATSVTISADGTEHPEDVGRVIGGTSVSFIGDTQKAPYIYGDIYGGGNLAQVEGNTYVNFYAGNFAGQIFGGGKGNLDPASKNTSADITGNTYVALAQDQGDQEEGDDGERIDNFSINVIWNQLWDENEKLFYAWDTETGSSISKRDNNTSRETIKIDKAKFYDKGIFLNPHNIYGGGNLACHVGGTAKVSVQKGTTPFSLLKTSEWKASYGDNKNPHFYVFGGGYGENTSVGNTLVTVDVEGDYGIYNAEAGDGDEQLAKPNGNGSLFDSESLSDGVSTPSHKKSSKRSSARKASTTIPIFDNSKGIPNFTILGVLGGGYAGIVNGDTKVTVYGNTFLHRVYGGGFGDPNSKVDNTTGQVKGNTEVYVKGANIYGDVFGGGAGVKPLTTDTVPFKTVAEVLGTTKVEISDDAKVYGKVYGGGDIANVGEYQETKPAGYYSQDSLQSVSTLDQTDGSFIKYNAAGYKTFVNIVGGDVFGNVYGGGKGLTKETNINYDQVGRINGNTLVHIANSNANDAIQLLNTDAQASYAIDPNGNNVPNVWNRIYGGCAYGTVDGNTLVHIEGGMLGLNIFGGGYGDVPIDEPDETDDGSGMSTALTTLDQVLGRKDTNKEGTYANILGNTKVQIDGGSWLWNKRADVNGNITTWVGAEEGKNKICDGLDDFKHIVTAIKAAKNIDDITDAKAKAAINTIKNDKDTQMFFDIENGLFKKNHNIFGGGNRACYVGTYTGDTVESGTGTAVVEINHSPVADIYDSDGNIVSMLDETTLQGLCWYIASNSKEHPQFSVFGAGYGANTKVATTKVYVRPGAYMNDDGSHMEVDGKIFRYRNQASDMEKYMEHETGFYSDFMQVSKEDKKLYYGSSDGGNADGTDNDPDVFVRYRASRMAWMLGVPNFTFFEIHGGGFSGYVTGDTYVETDNHLDCRNVFGAGLGAQPYGNFDSNATYDFGSIGGNAKVFMKAGNVSHNVYGGGAGIESARINGKEFTDFSARTGEAFDFPDMARVNGKTEVHIYGRPIITQAFKFDRTQVFGSVYGGGDVANVGNSEAAAAAAVLKGDDYMTGNAQFTSLVNIRGAKVFSQIYAGGNGRKKSECADYTKLGGIYGNACVVLDRPVISYPYLKTTTATSSSFTGESLDPSLPAYMEHPADNVNPGIYPITLNRIYGGCQNGTIYGNTLVTINGGRFLSNIFAGGWGACDTLTVDNSEVVDITSADVTGNTNMFINGGEMGLTAYWKADERSWEPAEIIGGKTYSPQYDHSTLKFKVNHNTYGGGNVACVVGEKDASGNLVSGSGNTYITIKKGLLYDTTPILSGQTTTQKFFESDEWKEVYEKIGSPHFGLFGGGYGENTNILGDTHIDIDMASRGSIQDHSMDIKEGEEYKHFLSGYSVMDVVGGGYSGKVEGETHIYGDGGVFCRRVFGGGFYNSVSATNVDIKAIDCHDIFGGGLMGDIMKTTNVNIGQEATDASSTFSNADIFIHGNVYGANDVSGYVNVVLDEQGFFADNGGKGTNINIYGGNITGNVYGAGNGDYLYALDKAGHDKVTVNEYYPLNPNDPESEKVDLVYTVPMRANMPSYKAASDAAKIVNINSWRPLTNKVNILIKGTSENDTTIIKGDVYGGGNSATVQKVQQQGVRANNTVGDINLNIGSHVRIGRVFMGCNGDALFTASEDNDFMNKFQRLNGDIENYSKELNLADTIDWQNDPSNKGISTLWLSTRNEQRPIVYPHLLDLYFQPVETDIQGKLLWNGREDGTTLTDCVIGTFCCGGNRGNMNVYPKTEDDYTADTPADSMKIGNVFEYTFPAGLTITDKIVGGCNNANYDYKGKVEHDGGYLLGEIHSKYPFIKLNIRNKFQPKEREGAYVGGNVYGGCFRTGTIRGDVSVVLESDMLEGKEKEKLEKSNELLSTNAEYSALNVYGAGYGLESYVYGNCYVKMGKGINCSAPTTTTSTVSSSDGVSAPSQETIFNPSGTSVNFIYGGGQQGNVIGKTDVKVLNGHVFKSVTGGSYSGFLWGSTQIRVGFPKYYMVNAGCGGLFQLNRADQNNKNIDEGKDVASATIKQTMHIINDDVITPAVYDAITARYNFETNSFDDITAEQKKSFFTEVPAATPSVGWDNVNIVIGEAIYGGGYSLAHGSSAMGDNTTVLKYDKTHNLDDGFESEAEQAALANLGGTTIGYAGNTTVLIGDRTKVEASSSDGVSTPSSSASVDRDHITISRQDMKVAAVADGQDLLGYYYKDEDGKYHYIYQAGTYYKGGSVEAGTLPNGMVGEDVYQYDNEGGIFGDGHLSYTEGFRSAELTGYGFASTTVKSPKILNTFQRMDILRLTDNCFTLLGARDYATNAMDKTPYSISRVGEIQMIANNVVKDADGNLTVNDTIRSRNYMGFANNVHYLGALTSNVAFTDSWYDEHGKPGTDEEASTYQAIKQKYIDDFYKGAAGYKGNTHIFEERNNGTAKNMIGIASGYALKLLNVQELKTANDAVEEKLYYGPIYGVIEMNLIDVREDEGGGYVYADNVHKRTATEGETAHDVDFLETTGNFVFPYTPKQGRYIVDDCFPKSYESLGTGENPDEKIEAHYWYVTGFNYHYTAHITGFTFDSSELNPQHFSSNNTDGIVALSGLKKGQEVSVVSWRTYSAHDDKYECDLEKRNYKEGCEAKDKYVLNVGAANSTEYVKPLAEGEATPKDPAQLPGFAALLSMEEGKNGNNYEVLQSTLPTEFTGGDARIVFQLTDKINNTTTDYYNAHLSESCKGSLVLAAPALDNNGNAVTGNISIKKLYTRSGDGTTVPYTYTEVKTGKLSADTEYFYKSGETNFYQSTEGKTFSYVDPSTRDTVNVSKTDVELGTDIIYYCNLDRYYTYTIDLTIDYVQGPDIEGNITIENCALPGEMVRLKKDKVKINADQAFSVNGYYWRIGKRHEVNGEWTFDDTTPWSKSTTAKGYDTFNQADKEGAGLFAGCHYDKTEDYLDIPVYYFMNGYGVQLGVTMNVPGLNDILPVKMIEADKLTVHNYQRMNSQRTGIDLHLAEAIKRAKDETSFAEPRIYISNQSDLASFIQFVDSIGTNCDAPRYGANAQFVLQNDVTMPSSGITLPADFAGTLHGNGYVINGIGKGNALFNSISGNVYNLGLSSGKISNKQPSDGKLANYHCCYEYAPEDKSSSKAATAKSSSFDGVSTPSVYRMDGTLIATYTPDDFRLGRVAYDLNEYYLRARYSNATADDKAALKYVYDYYANGDYQYAHRTDAITGKITGITYLRTGKDSDLPNYEQAETRHDRTHTIDKARAQQYVAATAETPESREGDYLPLFNANSADGSVTDTETQNDFLFWGQSLQSTPADYPNALASHQLNYMTNRVYRAAGYYGDNTLDAYHYNAYYKGNNNMGTFVHNTATTAIDFTCQNDPPKALGMNGSGFFYAPLKDNATTFFDFTVKDGVTKNLLVYTDANSDDLSNDTEAYDVVNKALSYNESTRETLISGHHIAETTQGDDTTPSTFSTAFLHLVERNPEGMNSEGDACGNNNLCVPIPFTVTNRAWYIRKPLYYAEANTGAWEGICLPFTVHEADASLNGEITHFYGTPSDNEVADPSKNTHTLHHEYWLRGLMSIGTENGKTAATFQRPGNVGSGLFAPTAADGTPLCDGVSYTYTNMFFTDTYESWLYNKSANLYYADIHAYEGYVPLTANIPYIVRFPGERYYEFDLSSKFYNNLLGKSEEPQTVTFNAYGPDNTTNQSLGTVTIPVTSDMSTSVSGFSYTGTFSATNVADGSIYGMNADGTAFEDASPFYTVMPFRTYMAVNASGAKAHKAATSEIFISEPAGIDEIKPDLTPDGNDDNDDTDRLVIRPIGDNKVRIESSVSTTLNVYTTAGQLYRSLDVQPGTAVYSGFQSGAYIFGITKVMVSK